MTEKFGENLQKFDTNNDGEITKNDIDELSILLSKEETSEKKNELVEHLDYNLSEEDRKEIAKLLREKLGLVNGNITLTAGASAKLRNINWKDIKKEVKYEKYFTSFFIILCHH